MKKLRMDLDALVVESFETARAAGSGTVIAAGVLIGDQVGVIRTYPNCSEIDACPSAWQCTVNGTCYDPSCAQADTCAQTCAATCYKTCAGTCAVSCYPAGCSGPYCVA
jgi:hypothetical protein